MKRISLLIWGICLLALPTHATVNFYRAANGQLVVEATDCAAAQRLMDVMGLPDDPPTTEEFADITPGASNEEGGAALLDDDPTTSAPKQPSPDVIAGTQLLLDAVLGDDSTNPDPTKHDMFANVDANNDATDFDDLQQAFLAYVRDVNWKTGLKLTYRDLSFARRFRMACSGVSSLTKPLRVNLESYVGSLDHALAKVGDKATEGLINLERGHSFNQMAQLSVVGIAYAIEKTNPFLLLLVDEETFKQLVALEPRISTLYKEMYLFFKIRAIYMPGEEFDQNTKYLIRVSNIGSGDSFDTWHIMTEFAQKMLRLERAGKLNAKDEKEIHIWRLESSMYYIREQVRVEKRAAELAIKDPQNAHLVQEVNQGPKKKPSLDDRARELLRTSTQEQIKHLIIKYRGK